MEIFEALPITLRSNISQELPSSVYQRLAYLWKISHSLALTSITSSHLLSRSFISLVNKYAIELPSNIRYRICSYCCVLQLPSITCSVKVRRRGRESRRNIKLKDERNINSNGVLIKQKKIKNEIVTTCNICKKDSQSTVGCLRIPTPQKDANSNKMDINNAYKSPVNKSPNINNINVAPVNFTFNSIISQDRRSSAPGRLDGNFISLNNSNSNPIHNNNYNKLNNKINLNNNSIKKSQSSSIDKLIKNHNEKRPIGSVNLAELERMSKKNKRRKTLEEGSESNFKEIKTISIANIQPLCNNKPIIQPVTSSLGSLQGMLSNNVSFSPRF